jgi:predicted nucleotidyltransferase component of viral defense system
LDLESDTFFFNNFLFKGGTCLTKCYLGYYRFSEDLDFTYKNQDLFNNKSEKQIRKEISIILKQIINLIEIISKNNNLIFKNNNDTKYIEYGGGNKFITIKLWYYSVIENRDQFIKIQFNFVDKIIYNPILKAVNNIFSQDNKDILFLFPESKYLFNKLKIYCYDIKEIYVEKNRAILTRKGVKARDFIDVYLILKNLNKLNNYKLFDKYIVEKTKFMLKFEKYNANLIEHKEKGIEYYLGKEKDLLLLELDNEYNLFLDKYKIYVKKLIDKCLI